MYPEHREVYLKEIERLKKEDVVKNGYLLDGFPRNANQAKELIKNGFEPDCVIVIDVLVTELSDNLLSGAIPTEISNLRYLRLLGLDKNRLSGRIPVESLVQLGALRYLRMDKNKIAGAARVGATLGSQLHKNCAIKIDGWTNVRDKSWW